MSKPRLLGPQPGAYLVQRRSPRPAMSGHIAVPNHADPYIDYLRIGVGRSATWEDWARRATMLSLEDAVAWALVLDPGHVVWTFIYIVVPACRNDAGDIRRWERPRPNAPPVK